MKISDLKKYKLKSVLTICEKQRPVSEIAREMRDRNIGAIPITENNKLVGIVSERDIVTRLVLEGKDPDLTTASEIMTSDILTATEEDTIDNVISNMKEYGIRHMPVSNSEGKLLAFYSIRDFLKAKIESGQEIKKKHKNLAKYQIGVPIILILLCFLALILDLFSQKNIIIMFSVIFFIIGVFSVLMANKNVNYDNED